MSNEISAQLAAVDLDAQAGSEGPEAADEVERPPSRGSILVSEPDFGPHDSVSTGTLSFPGSLGTPEMEPGVGAPFPEETDELPPPSQVDPDGLSQEDISHLTQTSYWIEESEVSIDRGTVIGQDGFGMPVYAGKYLGVTDVAIKFKNNKYGMDNSLWLRELKAWSRLPAHDHGEHASLITDRIQLPNTDPPAPVAPLLGFRTNPSFFMWKRYTGGDMITFLSARGWDLLLSLELLHQAAIGVAFIHSKGIIHGDLKARNVMVDVGRLAKIIFFSCARIQSSDDPDDTHIGCTPSFASPECLRSESVGPASDVWSFGMMCYQVLCFGRAPFADLLTHQIMVSRDDIIQRGYA